jgi:hypothetical protein
MGAICVWILYVVALTAMWHFGGFLFAIGSTAMFVLVMIKASE